jgi:hypothetical protein
VRCDVIRILEQLLYFNWARSSALKLHNICIGRSIFIEAKQVCSKFLLCLPTNLRNAIPVGDVFCEFREYACFDMSWPLRYVSSCILHLK